MSTDLAAEILHFYGAALFIDGYDFEHLVFDKILEPSPNDWYLRCHNAHPVSHFDSSLHRSDQTGSPSVVRAVMRVASPPVVQLEIIMPACFWHHLDKCPVFWQAFVHHRRAPLWVERVRACLR